MGHEPSRESDGKISFVLFEGEENHPQGPRIGLGDSMGSTYRVKDDRLTQINRKMPHVAFTINVEDSVLTQDEKYLTTPLYRVLLLTQGRLTGKRGELFGLSRQGGKCGSACNPPHYFV